MSGAAGEPEEIAGAEEAHDLPAAVAQELVELQEAFGDGVDVLGRIALLEEGGTGIHAPAGGQGREPRQLVGTDDTTDGLHADRTCFAQCRRTAPGHAWGRHLLLTLARRDIGTGTSLP
jgi:hypothetical protein